MATIKVIMLLTVVVIVIGGVTGIYLYASSQRAEAENRESFRRLEELYALGIDVYGGSLGSPSVIIHEDVWFHFMEHVERLQPEFVILSDRGDQHYDLYLFNANYTVAWHFDLGYSRVFQRPTI
jgi:hypothetical protein